MLNDIITILGLTNTFYDDEITEIGKNKKVY